MPEMKESSSSPLTSEVLEFATVAVPFCTLLRQAGELKREEVIHKLLHLLPLLYLKALSLPSGRDEAFSDEEEEYLLPACVTEEEYTLVLRGLEAQLGNDDLYLEALSPEMQYSDRPLTARISEILTDVYQPLGNFVGLLRDEHLALIPFATLELRELFNAYWGDRVLSALRALHHIQFAEDLSANEHLNYDIDEE